jgi:hypothetical protein
VGVGGVAANPATTLTSTTTLLNPGNEHFTGVGVGFLTNTSDAIFGFALDGMDGSTYSSPYPGYQTISFQSNFNNQPAGYASPLAFQTQTGWSINSQDPVTGDVALPEPGSAALLVCGGLLAGACGLRRRRFRST